MPDAPAQLAYPHLTLDDAGVAWIEGTNTKVIEVVLDRLAHGLSAEEIHLEHPHLSLAGIHMALAYYPKKENEVAIWAQNPPPRAERGLIQGRDGRVLILGSSTEQQ